MKNKNYKFGTKAIHAGVEPDPATGAVMTPIYQSSTFIQEKVGQHKGYEYSRISNPTRHALEKALAELENGKFAACFGSGVAATDAVLKMLNPGDEVIATSDLYGGSFRIFKAIFEKYGIKFNFINMDEPSSIEKAIHKNTRLIWIESPTNPILSLIDIEKVAKIASQHDIWLAVDNTFATPFLQNPLDLGADFVVHSVTKYLSGHSDVVMGAVVTKDESLANEIYQIQRVSGAICGPMDAYLVLRGLKTLHLRMERHCQNAEKIAVFLRNHPKVDTVFWPGFKDHPNHDVAKKQMKDFGGMVSFSIKNGGTKEAHAVMEKFKIFAIAASLGGVESLSAHPPTMTHASVPEEVRHATGIVDGLIRLSVGVEDAEDLINDLKQALA